MFLESSISKVEETEILIKKNVLNSCLKLNSKQSGGQGAGFAGVLEYINCHVIMI